MRGQLFRAKKFVGKVDDREFVVGAVEDVRRARWPKAGGVRL
ncbi:hypothetical protein [Streptomyces sp. NPDC005141]